MLEPSPCCFAAGSGSRGAAAVSPRVRLETSSGAPENSNRQGWRIELECHLNTLA